MTPEGGGGRPLQVSTSLLFHSEHQDEVQIIVKHGQNNDRQEAEDFM